MHLEEIDPIDDERHLEWFGSLTAADAYDWPLEPGWSNTELAAMNRDQVTARRLLAIARQGDGEAVGSVCLRLPLLENTDTAELTLAVKPPARRRGAGSLLLLFAEERARQAGRHKLIARTEEPVQTKQAAGSLFARHHGFLLALAEERRCLDLPPPWSALAALEQEAHSHAGDYTLFTWQGACPSAVLDGRARLSESISVDAPQGELGLSGERWDAARVRHHEETVDQMGRDLFGAGALQRGSGELVAFSEICVPRELPATSYQWDTVVLPAHRGHRLGLLTKVANLRQISETAPGVKRILTWNAAANAPMIRINEAIGFRLAGRANAWQKALS
jgi:GNAT superfamily N-acetyltransferase